LPDSNKGASGKSLGGSKRLESYEVSLQQIKKVIVRDAIIENILRYIREANLQVGDKIPSERKLAAHMKVSRSSVREALKALQYNGLLEIRHGGGAFIRSLAPIPLYTYKKEEKDHFILLRHLIDARRMIEERVVKEMTPKISEEQVRKLYEMEEEQLSALEEGRVEEGSKFELPNMNFELAITEMMGNPVIYDLHKRVETLWKKTFKALSTTPFPPRERYSHHIDIIKGLESRKTRTAVSAMSRHNSILVDYIEEEIRKLNESNGGNGSSSSSSDRLP
jgi:GntR family transcriptional repressor for pyruvate dehydrogenase complex